MTRKLLYAFGIIAFLFASGQLFARTSVASGNTVEVQFNVSENMDHFVAKPKKKKGGKKRKKKQPHCEAY